MRTMPNVSDWIDLMIELDFQVTRRLTRQLIELQAAPLERKLEQLRRMAWHAQTHERAARDNAQRVRDAFRDASDQACRAIADRLRPEWRTLEHRTVLAAKTHELKGHWVIEVVSLSSRMGRVYNVDVERFIDAEATRPYLALGCRDDLTSELHPEAIDEWRKAASIEGAE